MTTSVQIQALQEKQIHLGLMIPPVNDKSLLVELLLQEPLVVVLPETHLLKLAAVWRQDEASSVLQAFLETVREIFNQQTSGL